MAQTQAPRTQRNVFKPFQEIQATAEEDAELVEETRWLKKRLNAINAIKSKPEYTSLTAFLKRPVTPDAQDLKISKRGWEKKIMEWRAVLCTIQRDTANADAWTQLFHCLSLCS